MAGQRIAKPDRGMTWRNTGGHRTRDPSVAWSLPNGSELACVAVEAADSWLTG